MKFLEPNLILICSGLTAFIAAVVVLPIVIKLAKIKNLLDVSDHRKAHKNPVPTLGGIGIFIGLIIALSIWLGVEAIKEIRYVLFGMSLLFIVGIWDDLKDLSAGKKFGIQLIVALVVAASGIRLESLHGLFGVSEINPVLQYIFTVMLIVGVTNAVNLLDGIDGLAGGIVAMNAFVFTLLFILNGANTFALLGVCLVGALLGFLCYNFNPARIFMGDTGSLVIGFLLAVMGLKSLQIDSLSIQTPVILVFSLLILPVFDTLRVFTLRICKGQSPFTADRNHIHHLLLKSGCCHKKSTLLMYLVNAVLIVSAYLLNALEVSVFSGVFVLTMLAIFLSELLSIKRIIKVNAMKKNLLRKRQGRQYENYLLTNIQKKHEKIRL